MVVVVAFGAVVVVVLVPALDVDAFFELLEVLAVSSACAGLRLYADAAAVVLVVAVDVAGAVVVVVLGGTVVVVVVELEALELFGTLTDVDDSAIPEYPATNLPSTALVPASDVERGWMTMRPLPVV